MELMILSLDPHGERDDTICVTIFHGTDSMMTVNNYTCGEEKKICIQKRGSSRSQFYEIQIAESSRKSDPLGSFRVPIAHSLQGPQVRWLLASKPFSIIITWQGASAIMPTPSHFHTWIKGGYGQLFMMDAQTSSCALRPPPTARERLIHIRDSVQRVGVGPRNFGIKEL